MIKTQMHAFNSGNTQGLSLDSLLTIIRVNLSEYMNQQVTTGVVNTLSAQLLEDIESFMNS